MPRAPARPVAARRPGITASVRPAGDQPQRRGCRRSTRVTCFGVARRCRAATRARAATAPRRACRPGRFTVTPHRATAGCGDRRRGGSGTSKLASACVWRIARGGVGSAHGTCRLATPHSRCCVPPCGSLLLGLKRQGLDSWGDQGLVRANRFGGVADGTRTHDDQNHNLGLYQLSYSHRRVGKYSVARFRAPRPKQRQRRLRPRPP
jgi:hypothetical protein